MSRRHHGGRPHRANGHARAADVPRLPDRGALDARADRPTFAPPDAPPSDPEPLDRRQDLEPRRPIGLAVAPGGPRDVQLPPGNDRETPLATNGHIQGPGASNGHSIGIAPAVDTAASTGCTAPQLRRFIKSRPYVPMHELRRRFGINGGEDDVTSVDLSSGRVFVGLPAREGALLGELLRGGEIGYELSLDPRSPVVVGLYPMRPVART